MLSQNDDDNNNGKKFFELSFQKGEISPEIISYPLKSCNKISMQNHDNNTRFVSNVLLNYVMNNLKYILHIP